MDEKISVGIADMRIIHLNGTLITYALGSCIGICLYDPKIKLAALIHIMLPLNMEAGRTNPFKYGDTGVRETIQRMINRGADKSRLVARIAGGAKMFEITGSTIGNIGLRNIESVRIALKKEGIRIAGEDVGGSTARTMKVEVETGRTSIHSYGKPERVL